MDYIVKPEIIPSVSAMTNQKIRHAYYMEPINGGYQLHRISIQEDVVLQDERVEDPDGWPEVIGYLEAEFAKEHFSK